MTPLRQILLALALLLILSSCAPRRSEVGLRPSETPPSTLVGLVDAADEKLVTLAGRGTISFESPENAGSASFDLSLRKPDSLLVAFEGPFGIDVGTLFLSRQQFVMYNSMENRVTTGVPTPRAIRSVVPFDLTYEQILDAFTGAFPVAEKESTPLSYTVDDEQLRLVYGCGNDSCSYWIDPADLLVRRYVRQNSRGEVLMEATTSGLIEDQGARIRAVLLSAFPASDAGLPFIFPWQVEHALGFIRLHHTIQRAQNCSVKRLLTYAILIFCLAGISSQLPGQTEIKKRQAELENIRAQIRTLTEKIAKQQKNEKSSLELLDTYDHKAALVAG